jgi:hypothetical protein
VDEQFFLTHHPTPPGMPHAAAVPSSEFGGLLAIARGRPPHGGRHVLQASTALFSTLDAADWMACRRAFGRMSALAATLAAGLAWDTASPLGHAT